MSMDDTGGSQNEIDLGGESVEDFLKSLDDDFDDGTEAETNQDDATGDDDTLDDGTETDTTDGEESTESTENTESTETPEVVIPESVQAEIKQLRDTLEVESRISGQLQEALAPHIDFIESTGINPYNHIGEMMVLSRTLTTGSPEDKAGVVAHLIDMFGVDLDHIDNALHKIITRPEPSTAEIIDQRFREFEQRFIAQVQPQVQAQPQAQQVQPDPQLQNEIAAFKSTAPHFDTVRGDMAMLLNAGRANNLKEAYDMACKINPTVAQQVAEQTKQVKNAAKTSIKGSPAPTKSKKDSGDDLDQMLDDLFDSFK